MKKLMLFEKNKQAVVSSRAIASIFNKQHQHVTQSIENLISENSLVKSMFYSATYETERGREYREYLMNRDGFALLVMGFTGKEALDWKLKYIKAFNLMENAIRERQSSEWLITRKQGKLIRRNETDAIADLIIYAEEQGSKSMAKHAYTIYSRLVNGLVGIDSGQRDVASFKTINTIAFIEDMINNTIYEEIENGTYYKEIYKKCKANGKQIMQFAYLHKLTA